MKHHSDRPFAASWERARDIRQAAHAEATVCSLRAAAIRTVVMYRDPETKKLLFLADSHSKVPSTPCVNIHENGTPGSTPSTASDIWPESIADDAPRPATDRYTTRRLQVLSPRSLRLSSTPTVLHSRALAILSGQVASRTPVSLRLSSARTVSAGLPVTPLEEAGSCDVAAVITASADADDVATASASRDDVATGSASRDAAASPSPGRAAVGLSSDEAHVRSVALARPPARGRQGQASAKLADTVAAVSSAVESAEAAVRAVASSRSRSNSRVSLASPTRSRSRSLGRRICAADDGKLLELGHDDGDGQAQEALRTLPRRPTTDAHRTLTTGQVEATADGEHSACATAAAAGAPAASLPLPSSTSGCDSEASGASLRLPAPRLLAPEAADGLCACADASHDAATAAAAGTHASAQLHAADTRACRARAEHGCAAPAALDGSTRGRHGKAQPCGSLQEARPASCSCSRCEAHDAPTLPPPHPGFFPSLHVSVGYGATPAAAVWSHAMPAMVSPAHSHRQLPEDSHVSWQRNHSCCDGGALRPLHCNGAAVSNAQRQCSAASCTLCRSACECCSAGPAAAPSPSPSPSPPHDDFCRRVPHRPARHDDGCSCGHLRSQDRYGVSLLASSAAASAACAPVVVDCAHSLAADASVAGASHYAARSYAAGSNSAAAAVLPTSHGAAGSISLAPVSTFVDRGVAPGSSMASSAPAHATRLTDSSAAPLSLASASLAQQAGAPVASVRAPHLWVAPPIAALPMPPVTARAAPASVPAPPMALASAFLLHRRAEPALMPAVTHPEQAMQAHSMGSADSRAGLGRATGTGGSSLGMMRPHAAAPFNKAFAQAHEMMEELRSYR